MQRLTEFLSEGTGVLILTPSNRRYFTGFASSEGYLLLTKDRAVFLTDGRYIEEARRIVKVCPAEELKNAAEQLRAYCQSFGIRRLLCETGISVARAERLKAVLAPVETVPSHELEERILRLRARKTAAEIARIRKAQALAEKGFEYILRFVRPGVSERQIALELEFFLRREGSEGTAFDVIAVSGPNSSKPHGVPGDRTLRPGDFLTLDFGAVADGYRSDMTRTVALGPVTDRMRLVYETVLAAGRAGIAAAAGGVRAADVDAAARGLIEKAGFGERFNHSTGHGVGLDIHEPLSLSPRSEDVLEPGNVVTVEPGIYLPGEFGVRIEDMVLITETGNENLTRAPKELLIL